MPLNRPALTLGPGSRGVQGARRYVVDICRALDRDELVECAELGVSELAGNAVLHGTEPITVAVRGTMRHPRVEVHDGSRQPPRIPTEADPVPALDGPDDADLVTVGRGLRLVSRVAQAWGAEIDADGKTVWFTPAPSLSETGGVQGTITGLATGPTPRRSRDDVEVRLLGVPVDVLQQAQRHFQELRREVRLLTLAHAEQYPLAHELTSVFDAVSNPLRDAVHEEVDLTAGPDPTLDLTLRLPRASLDQLPRLSDLLALSDDFCRQERLLTLARSPVQVAFQQWFVGECLHQAAGAEPVRWQAVAAGPGRHR